MNGFYVKCGLCKETVKFKRDRLNGWKSFAHVGQHLEKCRAKKGMDPKTGKLPEKASGFGFFTAQSRARLAGKQKAPTAKPAVPARDPNMPKRRGVLSYSQWDLFSSDDARDGHLACVGISTQLCVAVNVTGGLCEQSIKALSKRGVDLWSRLLGTAPDVEVEVEAMLKHVSLPVSALELHGPMLPKETYESSGLSVGDQPCLLDALTAHSPVGRSAWEMTDDRKRTHTLVFTKEAKGHSELVWKDSHPCKPDGSVAEKSEGKAVWLFFSPAVRANGWLQQYRYPDRSRIVQYTLVRVTVPDAALGSDVAKHIPPPCGHCGLCFVFPPVTASCDRLLP